MTNIFANRLINALSDLKNKFPEEYLEDVYNNLKRIDTTKEMTVVLIYVCIRLNMHDFARERISVYEQMYGKDDRAKKMEICVCIDGHKKMKEVIEALSINKNIPPKYYHLVDSLGFTPLHYAMIMDSKEAMNYLIESGVFLNSVPYILENDINKLFSYIIFAKLTQTNYSSHMTDFFSWNEEHLVPYLAELTEPEIMSLFIENESLYKAYGEIIKEHNEGLKVVRKATKQQNKDFFKELLSGRNPLRDEFLDAQDEKYEKYRKISQEYENTVQESLRELSNEIYKNAKNINSQCEILRKKLNKTLEELKESDVTIIQFLLNTLKNNKEKFIDIYNQIDLSDKCRLYNYKGFLIMLPDCSEFEFILPYRIINMQKDQSSEHHSEYVSSEKKYINSWFSNEAHFDKEILKAEYRILAKKYHPDTAQVSFAKETFIEIHDEYMEILNTL